MYLLILIVEGIKVQHNDADDDHAIYIIGHAATASPNSEKYEFFSSVNDNAIRPFSPGVSAFAMRINYSDIYLHDTIVPIGVWLSNDDLIRSDYSLHFSTALDLCPITGDIVVSSMVSKSAKRSIYDANKLKGLVLGPDDAFSVVIQRLSVKTLLMQWTSNYYAWDSRDVDVSDVKFSGDYVVFGGTTRGTGAAIGANVKGFGDLDGYVTKIRADTGELEVEWNGSVNVHTYTHSKRINSNPLMDDTVKGVCVVPPGLEQDHTLSKGAVIIVGTTSGILSQEYSNGSTSNPYKWSTGLQRAYVQKYDLDTLNLLWSRQIGDLQGVVGARVPTFGSGCAFVQSNHFGEAQPSSEVYLTGTTYPTAQLQFESDISILAPAVYGHGLFVAKFDEWNGDLKFVASVDTRFIAGSAEYEAVILPATGGGVATNVEGNAFVAGSILFEDSEHSDVFVLQFQREDGLIHEEVVHYVAGDDGAGDIGNQGGEDGAMQIIVVSVVIGVILLIVIMTLSQTLKRTKEIIIIDEEILSFSKSVTGNDELPIVKGEASLPSPDLARKDVTGEEQLGESSEIASAEQTKGQLV